MADEVGEERDARGLWHPKAVAEVAPERDAVRAAGLHQPEEGCIATCRAVNARHYSLTGELEREVWYDESRVLVRVRFEGSDGSENLYVQRCVSVRKDVNEVGKMLMRQGFFWECRLWPNGPRARSIAKYTGLRWHRMRWYLVVLAGAVLAVSAGSVRAAETVDQSNSQNADGWYIEYFANYTFPSDADLSGDSDGHLEFDPDFGHVVAAGYSFANGLRIELQSEWRQLDNLDLTGTGFGVAGPVILDGDVTIIPVMLNVQYSPFEVFGAQPFVRRVLHLSL